MSRLLSFVLAAVFASRFAVAAPAPSYSASGSSTTYSATGTSTLSYLSPGSSYSTTTSEVYSSSSSSIPSAVSYSTTESGTSSAAPASETVPLAPEDPNGVLWNTTTNTDPQPIRGQLGGTILAQQNIPLQEQNPDILAPPTTDHGLMYVYIWIFTSRLC